VDDAGASMLFITHDFAVLSHATTRCYVLDSGCMAEHGATADLLASPTTAQAQRLVAAARELSLERAVPSDRAVPGDRAMPGDWAVPSKGVQS
jgi:ABC-type glutathione transport system ATPase component